MILGRAANPTWCWGSTPGSSLEDASMARFEYMNTTIGKFHAETKVDAKGKTEVKHILVNDEPIKPTNRYWQSLYSIYGFNKPVFNYFDYAEVFNRIAERAPSDKLVVTVERNDDGSSKLLACARPNKPIVKYDDLLDVLDKHGELPDGSAASFDYHDGVVRSYHAPNFTEDLQIAGDVFRNRYVLDTPIDGWSQPSIYLMLLREICTNGAIAMAPAFRSKITMGKGDDNFDYPIIRALDSFNNEEGFQALHDRIASASKTWASIYETQKFYTHLVRLHGRGLVSVDPKYLTEAVGTDGEMLMEGSPLLKRFNKEAAPMIKEYGLANLDALTKKKQRCLPSPINMYEMLNFASEVATHHTDEAGSRVMQGFIGEMIGTAEPFDLENSCDKYKDWTDFFVSDANAIEAKVELQNV